jgi:hypothetical protein
MGRLLVKRRRNQMAKRRPPRLGKPPPVEQPPAPRFRSHTSIYISKDVMRELRRIAADVDKRPHDLLVEGVELVLRKYGKPSIAEIERKAP